MKLKDEIVSVNHTTGEVVTTQKTHRIRAKNSEEFYMGYIQTVSLMMKITSMEDVRLLAKLCSMMHYNTNEVHVSSSVRETIRTELGVHDSSISRSLARLRDLGAISGNKGTYIINPIFYWRGSSDSRDKVLHDKGLEFKIKFGGK